MVATPFAGCTPAKAPAGDAPSHGTWPRGARFALFLSRDIDQIHDREPWKLLGDLNHARRVAFGREKGELAGTARRIVRSVFRPKPATLDAAIAPVIDGGGLVTLPWHANFFNEPEYRDWQWVYGELLGRLAALRPWCATGAEIARWWRDAGPGVRPPIPIQR